MSILAANPRMRGDYARSMLEFFYWATPPMVNIPYRMVLDVLLESLGLPVAEYRTKACKGGLKLQRTPFSRSLNSCAWDFF